MYGGIFMAFIAFSLFAYIILIPVISYFWDPKGLRRYPNFRPLSGITDLVFVWESYKGFRSKALLEAHEKHPVLRIGPNSLSYGDVRAIKDIYGHSTQCGKDNFYSALAGTHSHLADVIDKADHARKRKVLSSAYALKNLEGWEHKVADKAQRLVTAFDARCTAPLPRGWTRPAPEDLTVDYRAWSNFFTLDAIVDIGLSERLGFLDAGNDRVTAERMDGTLHQVDYRECLHATARAQAVTVWPFDWYSFLRRLTRIFLPSYRKMWKLSESWNDIVYHRATQRLARYRAGEKLDDFFTALMEDKNGNPNNLEWGEIVAEISIMMNAGSDTTAIAMNNAIYLLLSHPRALATLRTELASVLSPTDDTIASYDTIRHLPYLRACLDESLRLLPPTTFGLPRRTPPSGCTILDEYIPGNTSVSISALVAQRSPIAFPNPDAYIPERWLGEKGRELQASFIAFSTGARGCIGRNISYLEQSVVLATVVNRYGICLEREGWRPERTECMNLYPGPMWCKIWRRVDGGDASDGVVGVGKDAVETRIQL